IVWKPFPRGSMSCSCAKPCKNLCASSKLSNRKERCNMSRTFRCAVLSAVKHDYVARGMVSHPRFELAVVADDPHVPDWAHERNQQFADARSIPYVRDVAKALRDFNVDVAIVSPEAERHCDLSIRAAL